MSDSKKSFSAGYIGDGRKEFPKPYSYQRISLRNNPENLIFAPNHDPMDKSSQEKGDPRELHKSFEIPVEGSLGILALGADGIKAWRAVRDAGKESSNEQHEQDEEE